MLTPEIDEPVLKAEIQQTVIVAWSTTAARPVLLMRAKSVALEYKPPMQSILQCFAEIERLAVMVECVVKPIWRSDTSAPL